MAPNGHAAPDQPSADRDARPYTPFKWLERRGSQEFRDWKQVNPATQMSFDEWKYSNQVYGLSLYHSALHVWDESDTSEEEVDRLNEKTLSCEVRSQAAREPGTSLITNGNGMSHGATSASFAMANREDVSAAGKKKRKSRKSYVSEEYVASDGDSGLVEALKPATESGAPTAPNSVLNGRSKSSSRKPRKKPISDNVISPFDEKDDPKATEPGMPDMVASPLPVRSAPGVPTTTQSPKKTILKLNTRKPTKKKVLSEEMVVDDDLDGDDMIATAFPPAVTTPRPVTSVTESRTAAVPITSTTGDVYGDLDVMDETASPEGESAIAAATRRGLRERRPAQQHPYSYGAQLFDEHETGVPEEKTAVQPPAEVQSRRESIASFDKSYGVDQAAKDLDPDILAILQGEVQPEFERADGRPKHFKGKGRAWKKDESDEDMEFNPGKKKAAKARAKNQPPKKRGRPRKSNLSEDVVREDSDDGSFTRMDDASPNDTSSPAALDEVQRKARRQPRRSALSEEVARKATEKSDDEMNGAAAPVVSTPVPKKRGRPRKYNVDPVPKAAAMNSEGDQSYTPKGTPNKSYAVKVEPKPTRAAVQQATPIIVDSEDEESELEPFGKSPSPPEEDYQFQGKSRLESPEDIEEYMAGVNMDSNDDDEELCT